MVLHGCPGHGMVSLDETGEAVSWAGSGAPPIWLDCARDFSEDWIHQAQIRDAVGLPPLRLQNARAALVDTVVRAMPHALDGADQLSGRLVLEVPDLNKRWAWSQGRQGVTIQTGCSQSLPEVV